MAWTPARAQDYTTGLLLRVKGSDVTGVANGGLISSITPTTGPTLTQSSGPEQPSYVAADARLNGHPGIRISTGQELTATLADATGSYSVAVACYSSNATHIAQYLMDTGTSQRWIVGTTSATATLSAYSSGSWRDSTVALPARTSAHVIVWTLDAGTSKTHIYVDGTQVDANNLPWTSAPIASPLTIFANTDAGAAANWLGEVGEFRIYAGALTSGQVAGVSTALSTLYVASPAPYRHQVVCYGNSITEGFVPPSGQLVTPYPVSLANSLTADFTVVNMGYPGEDEDYLADTNPFPSGVGNGIAAGTWESTGNTTGTSPLATLQALYSTSSYADNIIVLMEVTNSLSHSDPTYGINSPILTHSTSQTNQDIYNRIKAFTIARKAEGWIVLVATAIATAPPPTDSSPTYDARRQAINQMLRDDHSWADGLIDVGADPVFYNYATTSNEAWMQYDRVHPNLAGAARIAQWVYGLLSSYGTPYYATTTYPAYLHLSTTGTKRRLQ